MPSRVVLSLRGEFIPFETFTSAIMDLSEMLYEIDTQVSGRETIQWGIRKIKTTDNTLEAIPRVIKKNAADHSDVIVPTLLKGLRLIRQKATRPQHFTDDALESAKELTQTVNGYIHKIAITGSTNGKLAKPIVLTPAIADHVLEVIGPRYTAVGSVEGQLDMISIRRFAQFGIKHAITGRAIKCRFPKGMLEQVRGALGKRVNASGIVHYNAQGEPVKVEVEWIRQLRAESELPSIEEIGGSEPDFTEGLSTEEYIRGLRG